MAEGVGLVFPAMSASVALGALVGWFVALAVKHVVADFFLQTHWMAAGKDRAEGWALPLLVHCLIHGVLTTVLVAVIVPRLWFIGLLDFVIHIAIDRAKGFIVAHGRITADHPAFWWLIGIDQALHHLTGFGLAILLAVNA